MRIYVNWPKRPSSSLNARATSGASRSELRVTFSSPLERSSASFATSAGLGRYRVTASRSGCTALFLYAEPRKTGVSSSEIVPLRIRFEADGNLHHDRVVL